MVDREVVRSALQSLPQGTLPKNEENKNENLHETEVTSSSCDEDKNEQIKENCNKATKPSVTAAGGARVPQNATLNFYVLEEHPSSVSQSKSNQKKTKNDGEKEDSSAVTNNGEKEDFAAVINDGEKEDSADVIKENKIKHFKSPREPVPVQPIRCTIEKTNLNKNEPTGAHKPSKIRRENPPRTSPREPKNLRKRKFVHEYVNLSFKRFKFKELPDTEPPPAPTLHQLPSQLPDFAKESKLPLHVGLPPSQVPNTLGAGTFGPYWRSYYKKKPKTKFKKKFKKKFNVKFKNKYKCHYKYYNYHEAVLNFGVYTRLVAYTRIITDSFRVFDRGRRSGHDVTAGLHPPLHLPPGEDN